MTGTDIYRDISTRTDGDIYIGVVGPVRTGKSTFIKKFMEALVIPNIDGDYKRDRAVDELPQSAAGRTIMTTEPKFIPNEAVNICVDDNIDMRIRLIDCVGYIVPSALGYIENNYPRMVMTPWFDEQVPFNMAAEIGTQKVITEHSTIGLVVTTDGTIGDIPRDDYIEAETRVISELKDLGKPFVVLLNSTQPESEPTKLLARSMADEYGVTVIPADCLTLGEEEIKYILGQILCEFPVREIRVAVPSWVSSLEDEHALKESVYKDVREATKDCCRISEVSKIAERLEKNEYICSAKSEKTDLGTGIVRITLDLPKLLFYKVLGDATGVKLEDDGDLISLVTQLSQSKQVYDKLSDALESADATGYGIVTPSIDELTLDEPEIVKQGNRFGVRLKASAPSYHIIKADIQTEVSPIVGSEKQSEELVRFLLTGFEEDPKKIWESNIFGKSLHELVNEGLNAKLNKMPQEARGKVQETLQKIINEGSGGLICIIL